MYSGLVGDAFFIMCPDPGYRGGGREGGVTAPNCLEASQIGTLGQKKMTLGHLDKNDQKLPKIEPFQGFLFSKDRRSLKMKYMCLWID